MSLRRSFPMLTLLVRTPTGLKSRPLSFESPLSRGRAKDDLCNLKSRVQSDFFLLSRQL